MKIILKVCPVLISNYHFSLYFESWISSNWVSSPLFKSWCKTIYWTFIHIHFTIWRKNTATALWKGIIFTSVLCFKRYSFIKFLSKPDSAHNPFSNLTWCVIYYDHNSTTYYFHSQSIFVVHFFYLKWSIKYVLNILV